MKKRYILPIIFIFLIGISFIIPPLFNVVFLFSMPVMLIINPIATSLGSPIDTTYLVVIGTILQFFLIGFLWDFIEERSKNREDISKQELK